MKFSIRWGINDETVAENKRLLKENAELRSIIRDKDQAIAYWQQRYNIMADALHYTEDSHAAEREEWWELVEGWAQ